MTYAFRIDAVKFDAQGLVPVIAQDETTGDVLMLAWADKAALEATQQTGQMHYHSRSRGKLWRKGEESGNAQRVVRLFADCDGDAVLALVRQEGPACHTGASTCFSNQSETLARPILSELAALIEARRAKPPAGSYTARLFADTNLRRKKIGEEATELVMALHEETPERIANEAADVIYHVLVACAAAGVPYARIAQVLSERRQ
ncbi:MAG TPA: bifunctional phosphoribosyl-AMP cyclohydrolase/phosphoribosyl-ATP diphosphatase HisIE [Candidatus Thermoplasmatota archaeon]|nr:bifunctional phosphoribosyl-AMP cyclohydrolase/phosphoribosyl-ATP diphosphatase HisIE [Candidatus Thermoplasmatota archaeon]